MKKDGDAEFDRIFWQEKDRVYYTALKYIRKPEDAEEVVQEVFLKVFMALPHFRQEALLSTWIYRIALNEIFSRFRKENRGKRVELPETLPSPLPLPEEFQEWRDRERQLRLWVSLLPKKRGKVVFLRIFENLSFKEIGSELGMSEDSAKSLCSLGLKALKKKSRGVGHE